MSKAQTYPAEAVIELSAGLHLGPEFLGLTKPGMIGGVEVDIALPNFTTSEDGYDHEVVLPRRAQADWLGFFEKRDPEEERQWPFGSVSSAHDSGEITEFFTTRLLALPKGSSLTLKKARQLKRTADDWVRLLETWIEVVAREDLHQDRVKVEGPGQSAFVWTNQGRKPRGELLGSKNSIMLNFGWALKLTPWQWGKVLAKASDGEQPPEAHVFLRDARQALNSGPYRRSVLDSATAVELSLAKLRDDCLADSAPGVAAFVEQNAQQIGGLTKFLSAVGKVIPERIQQEIAEPRNHAIHEGRQPNQRTTEEAVNKVEEIVGLAFPWNKLL